MKKALRNILINSTLAFISAFIMTTIIHEFGHYLSYLVFGANPTLFHNYVQSADQSLNLSAKIISALAGPFISLLQGLAFGFMVTRRKGNTASDLFFCL